MSAGASFTESDLLVKQQKEMFTGPKSSHTQLLQNTQSVRISSYVQAHASLFVIRLYFLPVFAQSLVYPDITCVCVCVQTCLSDLLALWMSPSSSQSPMPVQPFSHPIKTSPPEGITSLRALEIAVWLRR